MKKVVQDLTSGGIDWQREKWQSGLGSKFIHQGEKNAAKYADEVIVLSKGVQDYFKETYGRVTHFITNAKNKGDFSMNGQLQYELAKSYRMDLVDAIEKAQEGYLSPSVQEYCFEEIEKTWGTEEYPPDGDSLFAQLREVLGTHT